LRPLRDFFTQRNNIFLLRKIVPYLQYAQRTFQSSFHLSKKSILLHRRINHEINPIFYISVFPHIHSSSISSQLECLYNVLPSRDLFHITTAPLPLRICRSSF